MTGAIIDMDGTLLDSMYIWSDVGERYLSYKGIEPDDRTIFDRIRYKSLEDMSKILIDEGHFNSFSNFELVNDINDFVEYDYFNDVEAKPGSELFLKNLKDNNIKTCLATATDRHIVDYVMQKLGLLKYFDCSITCKEAGGASKMHPDIYLKAMEMLNLPQNEIVVFEDTPFSSETAAKAGFKVAGVRDRYSEYAADRIKKTCFVYLDSIDDFIIE